MNFSVDVQGRSYLVDKFVRPFHRRGDLGDFEVRELFGRDLSRVGHRALGRGELPNERRGGRCGVSDGLRGLREGLGGQRFPPTTFNGGLELTRQRPSGNGNMGFLNSAPPRAEPQLRSAARRRP